MTEDYSSGAAAIAGAIDAVYAKKTHSHIAYGQVASTSTSTVFTATVAGVTELVDGTTVMLRNGVVTSAAGFTINVNGLGAKPVYSSMHDATADTTVFNINYTMLFVYDTTRVSGGCWICYRGYNTNDNTLGYQVRTNSSRMYASDKTYRYRILLAVDDTHYMPVNLSTSTEATTSKQTSMNTREFIIGGDILYYGYTSAINQSSLFAADKVWRQYTLNLGYSFNNTSAALSLTQWSPVYMVAEPSATNKGMAKLVSPYYTQSLPNSEDGKLYIYLGQAYNATNVELSLEHPVYEYKDGSVQLYSSNLHTHTGYASSSHTHTVSNITDFPSTMTPSSHSHNITDLNNVSTVNVTVTYTNNTTETIKLMKYTGS